MYGSAAHLRRSPVTREAAVAGQEAALRDRSLEARLGVRGDGAADWLAGRGARVPVEANAALRDPALGVIARLSAREFLILGPEEGAAADLAAALPDVGWGPCVPLPRAETHAWLELAGPRAADVLAKLCAVDLRAGRFADLAVAQTMAAEVSVIIIRDDGPAGLRYHVLVDSGFAEYLWGCLEDAMEAFR